jgi:hypothetical protein
LLALDAADLGLVGADREDRDLASAAKLGDVVGIAVDDSPSDAGRNSRFATCGIPVPTGSTRIAVGCCAGS